MRGVDIDHHLSNFAAIWQRHRSTANRGQLRPDEVGSEVVEFLLRESRSAQAELQDRDGGRAILDHQRRRNARGQLLERCLRFGSDLRDGSIYIRLRLQKDFRHGNAIERLRLNVFDIGDCSCNGTLINGRDAPVHLGRHKAGEGPDHTDDGYVDFRKNIYRSAQKHQRSREEEQKREYDKRIRSIKSEPDNPHDILLKTARAELTSRGLRKR